MLNGNELNMKATGSNTSYDIGDTTYTASEVGTLTGNVEFNSFAPYVGIDFGNSVTKSKEFGFMFDLGIAYQGSPDVSLSATGTLSNNATFKEELRKEEKALQDDLDNFTIYPVISLGVTYQF